MVFTRKDSVIILVIFLGLGGLGLPLSNFFYLAKFLENRKALNETEKRKKLEVMVNSVKEESKLKNSFDIVKLKKEDREILTRKSPCLYKLGLDNLNPDCAVSSTPKETQNTKQDDELLKKSNKVMNDSVNARKIIESVIEKIESKKFL